MTKNNHLRKLEYILKTCYFEWSRVIPTEGGFDYWDSISPIDSDIEKAILEYVPGSNEYFKYSYRCKSVVIGNLKERFVGTTLLVRDALFTAIKDLSIEDSVMIDIYVKETIEAAAETNLSFKTVFAQLPDFY